MAKSMFGEIPVSAEWAPKPNKSSSKKPRKMKMVKTSGKPIRAKSISSKKPRKVK